MSFGKLNDCARVTLLALALLARSSQIARADPTTLVCTSDNSNFNPSPTFDLNEARGTAIINYPGTTIQFPGKYADGSDVPPTVTPAHSVGPLAATFDSRTVTFEARQPHFRDHYTVDRMTLVITDYSNDSDMSFDQAASTDKLIVRYDCHIGKAQF